MSFANTNDTSRSRPLICVAAMVVGAVFVLTGVLGFVPGITTNFSGI